jgi:hypothetical protein
VVDDNLISIEHNVRPNSLGTKSGCRKTCWRLTKIGETVLFQDKRHHYIVVTCNSPKSTNEASSDHSKEGTQYPNCIVLDDWCCDDCAAPSS